MSVALTWITYDNSAPFAVSEKSVPILDCGTGSQTNWSTKQVFGLRWLGSGASNVKLWLDGTVADIYNAVYADRNASSYLREDLDPLGYLFKYTIIDSETLDDTVFNQSPSTWDDMPTTQGTAISLGSATLTQTGEAFSSRIAFAIYQPDTSSSLGASFEPVLTNLRFLAEFDTVND